MRPSVIQWVTTGAVTVAAAGAMVGCVSDHIIYKSTNFPAPPSAAGGFLGYAAVSTKATVCGNCHIDHQTTWVTTKHANAWADLVATGANTAPCAMCHTVNNQGNATTDTAVGYRSTQAARYQDVQCESCHGPGLTHVTSPSITNHPLASLDVGSASTTIKACGMCHHGAHEPFEDEWSQSRHATVPVWSTRAHPEANAACQGCHTGQGALLAWGVNTDYKEAGFAGGDTLNITCGVCHDPHSAANTGQLRFPDNVPDVQTNLCMKCHQNGSGLDPETERYGPHSPEGPLLLGIAGWFPPNLTEAGGGDTIVSTHGTTANPSLCATCHVAPFTVNDSSGKFVLQVVGHSFLAAPCLDATGVPTGDTLCAVAQRTFTACAASGCHGTDVAARSAFIAEQALIASLDTTLRRQLTTVLTATPAETASSNPSFTVAQGALFNARLAELPGSFVHNPFLMEALMTATIEEMTAQYGVAAARHRAPLADVMARIRRYRASHLAPATVPARAPAGVRVAQRR